MGWWSATIMGGDSPLDDLSEIAKICGAKYDYDKPGHLHGYHFTRADVEANLDKLFERAAQEKYQEYKSIFFSVIGAVVLWTGAKIGRATRSKIMREVLQDAWSKESAERRIYVHDLVEKLGQHRTGKRTQLAYEGLLAKLAQVMGG